MIQRYIVIQPNLTLEEEVIINPRTGESIDHLEFLATYIQSNVKEFHLVNIDETQNTLELSSGESHQGYTINNAGNFSEINYLIKRMFIFDVRGYDDSSSYVTVYEPRDTGFKAVEKVEGANNARGYDTAEEIEDKYDLDVNWSWDRMKNTLPTTLEI